MKNKRRNLGRRESDKNVVLLRRVDFEICPETSEHVNLLKHKLADYKMDGLVSISFSRDHMACVSISGTARRDQALPIIAGMRMIYQLLKQIDEGLMN